METLRNNAAHSPLVSVVMANYNTPIEYLEESINSILTQTYFNFELIIIDDASTDQSIDYIDSIHDERIIVLKNKTNKGVAFSRNRALDIAKGKYIAIMDSDDISVPKRFEKQVAFLEKHPNVIVCASWAEFFGNLHFIRKPILKDMESFRISLLFGNINIVNSTVMINHDLLKKNKIRYIDSYTASQDYRMWTDCIWAGDFAILPETLLKYRVHNQSISVSKHKIQKELTIKTIQHQLDRLHFTLPDDVMQYYPYTFNPVDLYDLRMKALFNTLIKANEKYKVYDQKKFKLYLLNTWAYHSAFGFLNNKGLLNKIMVLVHIPIRQYVVFIKKIIDQIQTNQLNKKTVSLR